MRKGVQKIYTEVAGNYELINHVLTFGLDIYWRKKAANIAAELSGRHWLDVCSGTGEMAQYLVDIADPNVIVYSVDFSLPMLFRAKRKKQMDEVKFSLADVGRLPFADNTFDLITISFASRNLNQKREILIAYLKEFFRVLVPGGVFLNLETSQPSSRLIRKLFHLYIKFTVKPIGSLISGSKPGYSYLAHTIPRFYDAQGFSSVLQDVGFRNIRHRSFLIGVAAIHTAEKFLAV